MGRARLAAGAALAARLLAGLGGGAPVGAGAAFQAGAGAEGPLAATLTCPDEHDEEALLQASQERSTPAGAVAARRTGGGQRGGRREGAPPTAPPLAGGAAAAEPVQPGARGLARGDPVPTALGSAAAPRQAGGRALLWSLLERGAHQLLGSGRDSPTDRASYAAPIFAVSLVVVVACSAACLVSGVLGSPQDQRGSWPSKTAANPASDLGRGSRQSLPATAAVPVGPFRGAPGRSAPNSAASLTTARTVASLPARGPWNAGPGAPAPGHGATRQPPASRGLGFASAAQRLGGAFFEEPLALSPASRPVVSAPPRLASVASAEPRRSASPGNGSVGSFDSLGSVLWPALIAPGHGGHLEVAAPDVAAAADGGGFFIVGPLGQKLLRASVECAGGVRGLSLSLVRQGTGEAMAPKAAVAPSARRGPSGRAELDIFGPDGRHFGTLAKRRDGGGPHLLRARGGELPAVVVNGEPGELRLTATAGDGGFMASTARVRGRGGRPEHLEFNIQPGVDTGLMLACMLSIILPL